MKKIVKMRNILVFSLFYLGELNVKHLA